jgi:hypothetical protein
VNVPKYMFKYLIECLKKSQLQDRTWVPYGRLLSEIFYQGGVLDKLSSVEAFTDKLLDTKTGKFINAQTLKNMKMISNVTRLDTDLSESSAKFDLMKDFPPICKKDPLDVQMHYIKDHYEATNKVIRLDEVREEMYGGALPRARGRKSKRKMTAEEYLDVEKPAKKAKTASDKLKIGGFTLPPTEEVATPLVVPDQPVIPKRKRKPTLRRTKDFPHVTKKVEAATTVSEAIGKAVEIASELQEMVMTEASQLLTIPGTAEDDQKRTAECSESSTTGNDSTHSEPVIHEISSDSPSTSLETSLSSSLLKTSKKPSNINQDQQKALSVKHL